MTVLPLGSVTAVSLPEVYEKDTVLVYVVLFNTTWYETEDRYEPLYDRLSRVLLPQVTEDSSLSSGLSATWDCVYFGNYPACEITADNFDAVDGYAVDEGSILVDGDLVKQLEEAQWLENETVLDGVRYRRMKARTP